MPEQKERSKREHEVCKKTICEGCDRPRRMPATSHHHPIRNGRSSPSQGCFLPVWCCCPAEHAKPTGFERPRILKGDRFPIHAPPDAARFTIFTPEPKSNVAVRPAPTPRTYGHRAAEEVPTPVQSTRSLKFDWFCLPCTHVYVVSGRTR